MSYVITKYDVETSKLYLLSVSAGRLQLQCTSTAVAAFFHSPDEILHFYNGQQIQNLMLQTYSVDILYFITQTLFDVDLPVLVDHEEGEGRSITSRFIKQNLL